VLEAIAKGRLDYAATLAARGFLPDWYVSHLRSLQQQGPAAADCGSSSAPGADVYGGSAVAGGAPDEYSHNARIVKAAICAGEAQPAGSAPARVHDAWEPQQQQQQQQQQPPLACL
jgi:hypothetical protein